MKPLYILVFLLCGLSVVGQDVMTIAATILDGKTKEPVSFVNIGFAEKGVGTVSNENGNFSLSWKIEDIEEDTILQISSIGYETKNLPIASLDVLTSYKEIVYLAPTQYALDEVVLVNEEREFDRLGSYAYSKENLGYWMNLESLGGEIATRININKKNTQLQDLTFNIVENKGDSLLVRVKIYDYHRGTPGKNLVTHNIFHTITKKEGQETISLKEHNIIANEDIIVSLELVKVYGSYIYFSLSSTPYGGISYTKERSMDGWKSYRGTGIAFGLIASYPSKSAEKNIASRKNLNKIDLYWDSSLSAKSRNVEEELKLLSKYLNHLGDVTIRVVKFSHGVSFEETFSIKNGKSKELEAYLENTYYNGAADFAEVLKQNLNSANAALVFTNGKSILAPLKPAVNIPVFCINSVPTAAHANLQDVSYLSGGHYINLSQVQINNALAYLKNDLEDEYVYTKNEKIDKSGYLHGVVYNDNNVPIQGATVQIKNTFTEVETGSNGSYSINAAPEDILVVKAFGMYKKDTVVGQLKKLHIPLRTKSELLDEVYLETKTVSELIAEEITDTPFGKKKRGAIGFSLNKTITSDDITETTQELFQVLNWGTGIDAIPQKLGANFKYRFRKYKYASIQLTTYAAMVIDGIVYDQNLENVQIPDINPQNIHSIILLESALSTVRFGSAAAYGAIVIETKNNVSYKNAQTEKEIKPSALATGNKYEERLFTLEMAKSKKQSPEYIQNLKQATTFDEAKIKYQKLQKTYGTTIPFYIETATYFETWDPSFANTVRSNIVALASENVKALRVLAFEYESKGTVEEAKLLYEHIVNLAPKDVQSYLDVARLNEATGDVETSEALYTQLLYNAIPNVSAIEVQEQVVNEFKKLIANHKSQINFKELPEEFLELGFKQDVRIVFDWNDPTAEFELQFVSPENKFYKFSHTIFDNKAIIEKEIEDGLLSKEFILDEAEKGRWLINVNHLGEVEQENPTYLKYTLYRNYGLPNETKAIKVINLSEYNQKITLDTFLY